MPFFNKKIFLLRPRFIILTLILIFIGGIFAINLAVSLNAKNKIYRDITKIPKQQTALVLGARVHTDGKLSQVLKDRLDTAVELFANRKIDRIIVSGDNSRKNYDETDAMRDYLLSQNIMPRAIFTDYAGFDTYDSIYRAREIFSVENLIIVTQEFHLPRALFIAKNLDIHAIGFSANLRKYRDNQRMQIREILANVKAFGNLLFHSKPKFLGDEIDIRGDGRESWDR
jgi:SanA protein